VSRRRKRKPQRRKKKRSLKRRQRKRNLQLQPKLQQNKHISEFLNIIDLYILKV